MLVVDTREQRPLRFSDAVQVVRGTLRTGDYSVLGLESRIAIERKSVSDLVQCVSWERGRFERELTRLAAFELAAIVVEGSVADVLAHAYRSATAPRAVLGSTLAWLIDHRVPTLWMGDADEAARATESLLVRFARRATAGSVVAPRRFAESNRLCGCSAAPESHQNRPKREQWPAHDND